MKYNHQNLATVSLISILGLLLSLCLTTSSLAQDKKQDLRINTEEEDLELEKKKENLKLFLKNIEILGRVEKPQTVFIVPGTDPTVDDIQIGRSFFKEIFRSVEKDDFPRNLSQLGRQHILW
jgi:hypothetical protein